MMQKRNRLIIGTRGSKLALWQANWVSEKIKSLYPEIKVEIEKIKTTGDKILDAPLAKIGGKGLFVKEIEEALLLKRIDLAVHSMKDVPSQLPKGLHISAICEREDPRDAFISNNGKQLEELPSESVVGTSSLRRTIQLKSLREDLVIKPLRGNVDTRIRKLKDGNFQAIVLAYAALKRMGLDGIVTKIFSEDTMIPSVGQGAIGIETRIDDDFVNQILKPLNHLKTAICVFAERAFLSVMGGGCQVPLACHAKIINNCLNITGMIGDPDYNSEILKGSKQNRISFEFNSLDKVDESFKAYLLTEASRLGEELARELLDKGGKNIIDRYLS